MVDKANFARSIKDHTVAGNLNTAKVQITRKKYWIEKQNGKQTNEKVQC